MSEQRPVIRLRTLTRLWLFGRYMYSIGQTALWTPLPHRAIGYGLAVFVPWLVLLGVARVPWGGAGMTWHVVVPAALVWWLLHVVGEGQRPYEVVASWVRMGWHVARTRPVRPVQVRERGEAPVDAALLVCLWVVLCVLAWPLPLWRYALLLLCVVLLAGNAARRDRDKR